MRAAGELFDYTTPLIEALLASARPEYGVLPCGWLPLDVDTFAMDNGARPRMAWVGPTRAWTTARWRATLGSHGFCLELSLRPGVQHSALETEFNFERVIPMA